MKQQVSGRVVNPEGNALQGAEVIVWRPGKEPHTAEWSEFALAYAQTDDDGFYLLELEVPEEDRGKPLLFAVRARDHGIHEGFLTHRQRLPQELRLHSIVLGPSARLRGRVVDHRGEPVPRLRIRIGPSHSPYHPDPDVYGMAALVVETDEDGRFENSWVNQGVYVPVELLLPDGGSLREGFSSRIVEEEEIRLPEFGGIEGVVTRAETGEPVSAAGVECEEDRACDFHHWRHFGKTDENGRFRISNVPPSRYQISVSGPGTYGQATNISVHPGESVTRDIACAKGIDLRGKVLLEDGSPAPGVNVTTSGDSSTRMMPMRSTDGDGGFVFEGLPPGVYGLSLLDSGVRANRTVDCRDGEPAEPVCFRLRTASVESDTKVRVVDASGGPVPGAWVGTDQYPLLLSAADDEGCLDLPFLVGESGDATPRIVALSSDMSQMGSTEPVAGSTDGAVSVRLKKPLRRVRSRVVTTQGEPIPGAVVSARASREDAKKSPLWALNPAAVADEDGCFEIGPVDPKLSYLVSASSPGYVSGMG